MPYIDFLQYCLDDHKELPVSANAINWRKLLVWAEQQAIVGVVFGGIQKAGKSLGIPTDVLFKWIGYVNQIEQRNKLLNKRCVELTEFLAHRGFDTCILKGQGNALLYPNPLWRTPGDIDVWIKSMSEGRCKRSDVIKYAKKQDSKARARYYHVEYQWKGMSVELHFMPGIMNNSFYNRRIQQWYKKVADGNRSMTEVELPDGVGRIPIPTKEFNIVFQLAHMMHHFFDEGIGLRQMIDYYHLLQKAKDDVRCKMSDVRKTLKYLNLYKFAGAVMYIMREVLGLDDEYLIVPVDERRGQTLLKEILKGGNFGHYSELDQNNAAKKYFQKTWRNMQQVKEYPAEALCEPIFRTWHFFWRMAHQLTDSRQVLKKNSPYIIR